MRFGSHHTALLVALVLACTPTAVTQSPAATPPPTAAPEPTPVREAAPTKPTVPVTVRDAADDAKWGAIAANHTIAKKVVIGRYASVRFEPEGEVVLYGGGSKAFDTAPVVDVKGERIQIIANAWSSDTGVLVWIDANDVAPQLVRPAVLHDHATRKLKDGDGTLELAPGEMIDLIETKGDAARVRTRGGELTGWIDADALGPTWEHKPFEYPSFDSEIQPSTTVYVRPGGPALHKLSPIENGTHPAHAAPFKSGWLVIEYVEQCHPTVRVRGFVRSKTTKIFGEQAGGFGCGGGGGIVPARWGDLESAPPVKLAKDTELLSKEGMLVGRMRSDGELRRGSDGVLRMSTGWGLLPVHTKP